MTEPSPARSKLASPYQKNWQLFCGLLNPKRHPGKLLVERIVLLAIAGCLFLSPATLVRQVFGLGGRAVRKIGIELYALAKMGLAFWLLFGDQGRHHSAALFFAWYLLVDLYVNIFGLVFLRGIWSPPLTINRNLILLGINFFEMNGWFSCLYLLDGGLRSGGAVVLDPSTIFYFSVVTSATVGFGDIVPTGGALWITVAHVILSLGFLAVVVSYFVGALADSTNAAGEEEEKIQSRQT